MDKEEKASSVRYKRYLEAELEAVALYSGLAKAEKDPQRAQVFQRLADMEEGHADRWAQKLGMTSSDLETYRAGFRIRLLLWLARRFGTRPVLPLVLRIEGADTDMYTGEPEAVDILKEERGHSRSLREMAGPSKAHGEMGMEVGHRAAGTSGTLRAAVLGFNDGLVSNFSLVMGVAGGVAAASDTSDPQIILLAGIAGLLAGAFSMAAGEYVSMRAQRDRFEYHLEMERGELEEFPEEEKRELVLIYQAKGLTQQEARTVADRIMQDPDVALDTMAREELGLNPSELGSPRGAAASSFVAFAAGATVPVFPYFIGEGAFAFSLSGVLSALTLLAAGSLLSTVSGKNVLWGGVRMLIIGVSAAAVTFGIGSLVGATLV